MAQWPSYLNLTPEQWRERVAEGRRMLSPCVLCPRGCRVERVRGQIGFCKGAGVAGAPPDGCGAPVPTPASGGGGSTPQLVEMVSRVASYGPHFGEEGPLVGHGGSGTIFFSGCNLGCLFCQNADISQQAVGEEVSAGRLAEIMVSLQRLGCHNINLVTPTHYLPQIIEAIQEAIPLGLRLPIVYNCGGYERVEALRLLEGIVDIYMPDAKFLDSEVARRLCLAPDYPERMKETIREMYRQVGPLEVDEQGIARRGLLVRHLVMPGRQSTSREVMAFLASLDPDIYVNVMAQYRPCHRAHEAPEIARRITAKEYNEAVQAAREAGLRRLDGDRGGVWHG